ncbi:MAG: C-terminal helicase domain-containing protein, partial [Bacilli bacterium]|nr:C-terminal helicase domain-containing protein [Bacilli bacterium]
YCEVSAKEIALDQLINQIQKNSEKCIVWTSYIENVNYLASKYEHLYPAVVNGEMTIEDRNMNIEKFKSDSGCRILFATPQSAKEGLTLTVANNVIFYDRSFSLDDYIQAQDRIHRISQNKVCYVYNILIQDSIDIWVEKLLEAKQSAASLGQGDVDFGEYKKVADYSYGEIVRNILFSGEDFI